MIVEPGHCTHSPCQPPQGNWSGMVACLPRTLGSSWLTFCASVIRFPPERWANHNVAAMHGMVGDDCCGGHYYASAAKPVGHVKRSDGEIPTGRGAAVA